MVTLKTGNAGGVYTKRLPDGRYEYGRLRQEWRHCGNLYLDGFQDSWTSGPLTHELVGTTYTYQWAQYLANQL